MKNTHGGKRKGSGRKPDPDKKVKITVLVKPDFKKIFPEYAKKINESQGSIITRLVEAEINEKDDK
ncbi:MAG: hypothetical protein GY870_05755 [archaeon]|nr:hypothetical protein [archaeon]